MSQELEQSDAAGQLVEVIQNYPFLFDLSNKDYKNNLRKEQAWKEIGEIVNRKVEECQKMWKNLRNRFTKEKRGHPSGSEAAESNWFFYDKMLFYNKYTRPRKIRTTTTAPVETSTGIREESRSPSSCSSPWSTMGTILSPPPIEDNEDEVPIVIEEKVDKPKSRNDQKRKRHDSDNETNEIVDLAKSIAGTLERRTNLTDPNRSFAEYVCSRLSEMPHNQAQKNRKAMLLILEEDNDS